MIRFGVVGAGFIARQFVRDARLSDAKVVAIASRSKEKADAFLDEFNLEYSFGSYEEMAKSDVIDAVYIATPHSHHLEHSLPFINAGKHVLIEKAITANTEQLTRLHQAAKDNGVLVMEAMWTRFLPSSQFVLKESKKLGKLTHMDLEFGYSLIKTCPITHRLLNPDLAGGSILDIGVYPISFMFFIKELPVKHIHANGTLHQTGVDITADIDVTFTDGTTASIRSTIDDNYDKNAVFTFEHGVIEMVDFSRSKEVIINGTKKAIPFEGEGFVYQINSFVNSIKLGDKENPVMTYQASLEVMQFMDEVRKQLGVTYPFE